MICLWSADPTEKNLIHDLYSVVTRLGALPKCENWHFSQEIRGCYKGVSFLSILVSVGVF